MDYSEIWISDKDGSISESVPNDASAADEALGKLVRDSSRMYRAVLAEGTGIDTGIVILAVQPQGLGACGVALAPEMTECVIQRLRQTADILEANDHKPTWN